MMQDDDGEYKFIEFNASCLGLKKSLPLLPLIVKEAVRQTARHNRRAKSGAGRYWSPRITGAVS